MDEAQTIWRDMKVRKSSSRSRGSIEQVKVSTDVNRNDGAGGGGMGSCAGSKSMVRLRDVRLILGIREFRVLSFSFPFPPPVVYRGGKGYLARH